MIKYQDTTPNKEQWYKDISFALHVTGGDRTINLTHCYVVSSQIVEKCEKNNFSSNVRILNQHIHIVDNQ